jgi:hypothetical protein
MTLEEVKQYYTDIDKCHGNCNTCYNYYLCDYLTELILNSDKHEEEIKELTKEKLERL